MSSDPDHENTSGPVPLWTALSLVTLSGMGALVFQVVSFREFRAVFGSSTAATGAVLAVFMGGVGLGNVLLGRTADRTHEPLRLFGLLEIGIAVLAGLSPFLVGGAAGLYSATGGQSTLGLPLATAIRLLIAMLVLLPPTILMGGTMPAIARVVTTSRDAGRHRLAIAYAANTLGALVGVLGSNFWLLELLGNRTTLWAACSVNLSTGIVAIWLSRGRTPATASSESEQAMQDTPGQLAPGVVFASALATGFVFFLMELVWFRMLGPLLGGTTFTFGIVLATALLGIGIGSASFAVAFRQRLPEPRDFGVTCLLASLWLAFPLFLGDRLALLTADVRDTTSTGFLLLVCGWTVICAIVVLPFSVVSGFQFPLLIALLGRGRERVGRHVGAAFAFNTLGAILGSLAGGFGLMMLLTAPGAWRLCAVVLLVVGWTVTLLGNRDGNRVGRPILPVALSLLVLVVTFSSGPTAVWRHSAIGAGREPRAEWTPNERRAWMNTKRRTVVWERDGVEVGVAIAAANSYSFVVSGKVDGNSLGDFGTQVMCGMLGSLLHPEPENALVVGLGTGETAGWLAQIPTVQRVDVVELEPALDEMVERCAPLNHDVLANERVHRIYNDAREVLQTTDRQYDLIASEPSNPFRAGVASLYTTEFYEAARSRLADDGVLVQFVQGYEIDEEAVAVVLKTVCSVFPYVEIWESEPNDMLLVCSVQPLDATAETIREVLASEPRATAVRQAWSVTDVEGVLAHRVAGPAFVRAYVERGDAVLNTDDRNVLEYSFARTVGRDFAFSVDSLRSEASGGRDDFPGDVDWGEVEEQRATFYARRAGRPPRFEPDSPERRHRLDALRSYMQGDHAATTRAWERQDRPPRTLSELSMMAHAYSEVGSRKAQPILDALRAQRPADANLILASTADDDRERTRLFVEAFEALRTDPWAEPHLVDLALERSVTHAARSTESAEAILASLDQPFVVRLAEEDRLWARLRIASRLGDQSLADALAEIEPNVFWSRQLLESRVTAYTNLDHPLRSRAEADLRTFLANEP